MARMVKPLSPTRVENVKAEDKEHELPDGRGLYLRVRTSGTKTWLFRYQKPSTKKRTNLVLGSFPELSLASARFKREEARELLAQGKDPKLHRDAQNSKLLDTLKCNANIVYNLNF